jgi:hypothetical protein
MPFAPLLIWIITPFFRPDRTGEIQSVLHHEFGHGVQDHILGYQGDQGMGEGNGDILANLLTRESHIGRGFFEGNCTSGIRNSLNTLQYPDDVVGHGVHDAGRVIVGFHWDFMMGLWDAYREDLGTMMAGERWHYSRVLYHPTDQPAQVLATFMADDDDGNLDNGTPHYDYLCIAAEQRWGLGRRGAQPGRHELLAAARSRSGRGVW